jgi:hypothetical protein
MNLEKKIEVLENHHKILNDENFAQQVRNNINNGAIYVVKNFINIEIIERIKTYLQGLGSYSLPNYQAIELGTGNFHRINKWDERAYVKGCFHQFVFYPWNQDVFGLFEISKEVFQVKNIISGNNKDKFLGMNGEEGCITRLAFQFYPKGTGGLNKHRDPVDHHQLTVPILTMSEKGKDFKSGGSYVEMSDGTKVYIDEISSPGDLVYFNANMVHGVDMIDPENEVDWLSFQGRWMLLFAINKLASNTTISNAIDLEDAK